MAAQNAFCLDIISEQRKLLGFKIYCSAKNKKRKDKLSLEKCAPFSVVNTEKSALFIINNKYQKFFWQTKAGFISPKAQMQHVPCFSLFSLFQMAAYTNFDLGLETAKSRLTEAIALSFFQIKPIFLGYCIKALRRNLMHFHGQTGRSPPPWQTH